MLKKTLLILFVLAALSLAWAQVPFSATYTFDGTTGHVASFVYNGTTYEGVSMGDLLKVGVTSSSSTGNFRANNWPLGATNGSDDFDGVLDPDKYFGLTISAQTGYHFSLSTITFGVGRSATGIRQSQWRGSADDFTAPFANYTTLHAQLTNTAGVLTNPDANSSWTGNVLNLGTTFTNITTSAELRYYLFNAESATGTAGLQGPITISGTFAQSGGLPNAATPTFSPAGGLKTRSFNATISCATANATIYYTTDGTAPSTSSAVYTTPINVSTTMTIRAMATAPNHQPSGIGSVTYTFPVQASTIAALRAMPADNQTVYRLNGEAILTYQKPTRNQKYVQDATGAILIDDNNNIITTTYNVFDGITGLIGTLNSYSNLLQFIPVVDPGAATSSNNTIPEEIRTLASLTEADQAKLIKVENVSFLSATGNFAASVNYNISDPSGTAIFRTAFNLNDGCNYIGTPIPTVPQDIWCLVGQFNNDMQITARFLSDFEDSGAAPNLPTKLAIINIDPASPYVNSNFSVTVQAQNANNAPGLVTQNTTVSLIVNDGNGGLSGTVTGTIVQGESTVTISGVQYDMVESGVTITAAATSGMTLLPGTSSSFDVLDTPIEPTVTVLARPSQINLADASTQSAVLMQLQSYPTDDVRYRLYNGGNQYAPWDPATDTYVTSTSYGAGPLPIGTPTTSAVWWIVFERGSNNSTVASYRDRQGPGYSTNFQTQALPAATEMTEPFEISLNVPLSPARYDLNNKYVVLGYDAEVGGTLITAASTDLNTGAFVMHASSGTVIRRIEVRALNNTLMESITGEWDGQGQVGYYDAVEGLEGTALRSGLRTITSTGHLNNSWDSTRYHIYAALDNVNNTVTCVYTNQVFNHPAGTMSTPEGLSAEHSYPREWFTGHAEYNWMDTDLHALFPATQPSNSARSNYPYDYVSSITSTWGSGNYFSYGGLNANGNNAFDVADQFKGDAARALLYMGMRYYTDDANFTQGNVNLIPILLQWHAMDPVDAYEISRNEGIFLFQGNRNPFIDHPQWIDSIWGTVSIAAPVAILPTNVAEHGFTANWEAVTGAASYRLDVSTSSGFYGYLNGFKNRIVNGTSESLAALDPATTYYYRVRAIGPNGEVSHVSNTIYATTTVGGSVVYYWNFNDNVPATGVDWDQNIASQIGSGSITYNFTAARSFAGTTLNGESGEVNGGAFCPIGGVEVLENNGNFFEMAMPSTGLQNLVLTYATRGTSTGFTSQQFLYTTDGVNYQEKITFTDPLTNNWLASQVRTVDFSDVPAANNNPNFKIRVVLDGATYATGNNRFDNIKVFGTPYSGGGLETPQNVTIVQNGANVTISWQSVAGATGYRVYATDNPGVFGGTYTPTANTSITVPAAAAKQFYRVTAVQ